MPTTSRQARMELRRLKQEVRNKHAVTVIWAYWQGTKVFQPQPIVCFRPSLSSLYTVSRPIPSMALVNRVAAAPLNKPQSQSHRYHLACLMCLIIVRHVFCFVAVTCGIVLIHFGCFFLLKIFLQSWSCKPELAF